MRFRFLLSVLLLATAVLASARSAPEQARIDFLLHRIETAEGVTFIRNGSDYPGAAAAKHLRRKLDYAGERLQTAEQFIQYCATESSFTHRKYMVRLADGKTLEAAEYFRGLLHEFEQRQH